MDSSLNMLLSTATQKHGAATIYLILESLMKTHALHMEKAEHGFFLKCHYRRQSHRATRTPSPVSSLEATSQDEQPYRYERDALLRSFALVSNNNVKVKNTFIHMDNSSGDDTSSSTNSGTKRWARSAPGRIEGPTIQRDSDPPSFRCESGESSNTTFFNIHDVTLVEANVQTAHVSCSDQSAQTDKTKSMDVGIQTKEHAQQVAKENLASLSSISGKWFLAKAPSVGSIVEAESDFLSGEELSPTQIRAGFRGSVIRIDKDGDAMVYFPALAVSGLRAQVFVMHEDFRHLKQHAA